MKLCIFLVDFQHVKEFLEGAILNILMVRKRYGIYTQKVFELKANYEPFIRWTGSVISNEKELG